MSDVPEGRETTPFDQAWSFLGSSLIATGIAVFLILTVGGAELFSGKAPTLTDGSVVATAYFGALLLCAGLVALACLGLVALTANDGPRRPPWPRYRSLEDDKGRRSTTLAVVGLVIVTLVPTIVTYACLYKYVTKSSVTLWSANTLPSGFWSSRIAALGHDCEKRGACFRMHIEHGAPEWFVWSDPLLAIFAVAALVAWGALAVRMLRYEG
jgi:hypothetical protein